MLCAFGALAFAMIAAPAPTLGAGYLYATDLNSEIHSYSVGSDGRLTKLGDTGAAGQLSTAVVAPDSKHLYAGGCGTGICVYTIGTDGSLTPVSGSPFAAGGSPQALSVTPDGKRLYAGLNPPNGVVAYDIGPDGGLSPITGSPFPAGDAINGLSLTPDGRHLYTANSDSFNVSAFEIQPDGSLVAVPGSPFATPDMPLTLTTTVDGSHLYVPGGPGEVFAYAINPNGSLTGVPGSPFPAGGHGSIGTALSPNGANVYLANQAGHNLGALQITSSGSLAPLLGAPFAIGGAPSDALIEPGGSFLYSTVGSTGAIAGFSIGQDGGLSPLGGPVVPAGTQPWGMAMTPAQGAKAAFTVSGTTAGDATTFDASSSKPLGLWPVARYSWDFGDGSAAANGAEVMKHAYASGTYTVTLTVADAAGCSLERIYVGNTMSCNASPLARISQNVTIDPPEEAIVPPRTKLAGARINQRKNSASFRFSSVSPTQARAAKATKGFHCKLAKRGQQARKFKRCTSPKRYKRLKPGRYKFKVRAYNEAGKDKTPAEWTFRIRP